jgi:hypothetical protein
MELALAIISDVGSESLTMNGKRPVGGPQILSLLSAQPAPAKL